MKKLFFALLVACAMNASAQEETKTKKLEGGKFRIALNGGFSRLLAKTAESVGAENKDYVSALKSGINYGVDGAYFVSNIIGVGLKFNQFRSSHEGLLTVGPGANANIKTDQVHTFIGPTFGTKFGSADNKHLFVFTSALGYMGFWSHNGFVKTTGDTVGSALDLGYDYNITKQFAIGTQISFVGGTLSNITYTSANGSVNEKLDKNNRESMARMDISFGARFSF
ncbi:MAG: hypothetical protein REI64_09305 [Pedobacter sp.]|uniref:hypothetical protein n=1 Tax=Pedobacter sp. TaxID=1411316 RepID=UPI0028074BFA|nr:hypothetical protein [Pedobacter sp.]MDQ8004981.1 hypothetical protein [Pedobacter sp.]